MTRFIAILTAVTGLILVSACQTVQNPATGESQFTTISPAQERQIGRQEHPKILAQFGGEVRNPRLKAYVESVGRKLAANAEIPADQFTFTVLDSPVVNAFALPGGYIYITRGMLALLNSEAEMAGVIGHEIGHVTARHGAARETRGLFTNLAVIGAAVLSGSQEVAQLGQSVAAGYLAGYSRDQERQSDSLGIRYLSRAGYDPDGMSDGLEALGRHGQLLARMSGQEARNVSALSTHPQTPERVAATAREARSVQKPQNAIVGREAFLNTIDGMIWGDSPEQGFVRGNRFSHPILKFTFSVPEAFRMDNLPQAVVANERNGRARIIFDQEPDRRAAASGMRMDTYIARHWASGTRLEVLDRLNINGMDAATAVVAINSQGQRLDARLVAIRFDGSHIYRFILVTPANLTRSFSDAFRDTAFSFRRLNEREVRRLKPQRLEVVRVRRGDSVSRLTRSDIQDGFEDDRFRTINAMDQGNNLRTGDLVKVVQ
jgi:predicted Zn-dependent protease